MPGHELAQTLLQAAESDLKALKNMSNPDAFDDRVFEFHAQQATERRSRHGCTSLPESIHSRTT